MGHSYLEPEKSKNGLLTIKIIIIIQNWTTLVTFKVTIILQVHFLRFWNSVHFTGIKFCGGGGGGGGGASQLMIFMMVYIQKAPKSFT